MTASEYELAKTGTDKPMSEMDDRISELESTVSSLEDLVSQMQSRLEPVLTPSNPAENAEVQPIRSSSQVSIAMEQVQHRVSNVNSALLETMHRLAV